MQKETQDQIPVLNTPGDPKAMAKDSERPLPVLPVNIQGKGVPTEEGM